MRNASRRFMVWGTWSQLVVLFGEVMEPAEGGALLGEGSHWGVAFDDGQPTSTSCSLSLLPGCEGQCDQPLPWSCWQALPLLSQWTLPLTKRTEINSFFLKLLLGVVSVMATRKF